MGRDLLVSAPAGRESHTNVHTGACLFSFFGIIAIKTSPILRTRKHTHVLRAMESARRVLSTLGKICSPPTVPSVDTSGKSADSGAHSINQEGWSGAASRQWRGYIVQTHVCFTPVVWGEVVGGGVRY